MNAELSLHLYIPARRFEVSPWPLEISFARAAWFTLMNCSDQGKFNSTLQKNFSVIYPSATVVPNQMTDSIITVVESELAGTCKVTG